MKKTVKLFLLITIITLHAFSCKKAPAIGELKFDPLQKNVSIASNPVQSNNRNMTVVYLIPTDLDTIPNFRKRFDGVLKWVQGFYAQEMDRNGYGPKTFGLAKDPATQLVQVNVIKSSQSKANFDGNLGVTEVNNFYAANPSMKQSQHVLIIMPSFSGGSNPDNSNPFYGTGRYCYVMDYIGFNISNIGTDPFTKWLGGLAHEMGHAFNAAHDKEWVTEKNILGTALMGGGNYTLGKTPTFIAAADAAVFNNNEVFNNNTNTYYSNVVTTIPRIYASYSTTQDAIICSGKFTSTGNVAKILYYNDPNVNNEGTGTNKDYNAVTWVSPVIGTDSFNVVMPVNEFWEKSNGMPYELKVKFVHNNGTITQHIYNYTFQNGVPAIKFDYHAELNKTGWTIQGFSSQETGENGFAANVIDNSTVTFWHSRWSTSPTGTLPHFITINLGGNKTANGVALQNRQGSNRAIKDFQILTSTDGINFISQGNFTAVKTDGTQYFKFASPQTIRYFKLIANTSWDGTQNAAIAELGLY
ncbi:discoidin domain-containing protein [Pedobacter agri]|uniref:discoidin domain-containing protein n=1 Tax=Pedobacter agri TaxID=454586 RepID=UPI002930F2A3|nr:discoidin domain-containing protein [Pedobacter agri]